MHSYLMGFHQASARLNRLQIGSLCMLHVPNGITFLSMDVLPILAYRISIISVSLFNGFIFRLRMKMGVSVPKYIVARIQKSIQYVVPQHANVQNAPGAHENAHVAHFERAPAKSASTRLSLVRVQQQRTLSQRGAPCRHAYNTQISPYREHSGGYYMCTRNVIYYLILMHVRAHTQVHT